MLQLHLKGESTLMNPAVALQEQGHVVESFEFWCSRGCPFCHDDDNVDNNNNNNNRKMVVMPRSIDRYSQQMVVTMNDGAGSKSTTKWMIDMAVFFLQPYDFDSTPGVKHVARSFGETAIFDAFKDIISKS